MDSKIYKVKFIKDENEITANEDYVNLLKIRADHVGTTSGNYWVEVYGAGIQGGKALFKPIDYDEVNGANMELIYSEIAKLVLENTRIPKITLLEEEKGYLSLLSHRVLDRNKEDMEHIDSYIYYKYEREEQRNLFSMGVDDILECVKIGVDDLKNYEILEKEIIKVVLLDCFLNNADRHGKNWGLVRGKENNWYELAIFDHVKSFININSPRVGYSNNMLWSRVYMGPKSSANNTTGDKTVKYIKKQYPEYYEEFVSNIKDKVEMFYEIIANLRGVNARMIKKILDKKIDYMEHCSSLER